MPGGADSRALDHPHGHVASHRLFQKCGYHLGCEQNAVGGRNQNGAVALLNLRADGIRNRAARIPEIDAARDQCDVWIVGQRSGILSHDRDPTYSRSRNQRVEYVGQHWSPGDRQERLGAKAGSLEQRVAAWA